MRGASSATAWATVGAVVKSPQVGAERCAVALGGVVVRPCVWARGWAGALARLARSRAVPRFCWGLGGAVTVARTTIQSGTSGWSGRPRPVSQPPRGPVPSHHRRQARHRDPVTPAEPPAEAGAPWAQLSKEGRTRTATVRDHTPASPGRAGG